MSVNERPKITAKTAADLLAREFSTSRIREAGSDLDGMRYYQLDQIVGIKNSSHPIPRFLAEVACRRKQKQDRQVLLTQHQLALEIASS